jgi:glucose-6-phosphate isomerase
VYLDYSKSRITDETLNLLLQLAEEARDCARGPMRWFGGDLHRANLALNHQLFSTRGAFPC